ERRAGGGGGGGLVQEEVVDAWRDAGGDGKHHQGERADDPAFGAGDQDRGRGRTDDAIEGGTVRRDARCGQLRDEPGERIHQLVGHHVNHLNSHAGQVTATGGVRR